MDLRNKRVLVTGADGFIGSHLTAALLKRAGHVRALAYYNSLNSLGWLDSLANEEKSQIDIVSGDIRDSHAMMDLVKGVDVVFHLAALIAIPFSYVAPELYIDTNIKGTLNMLQAARHHGCSRILVTSTSEVYGTARKVPIAEDHPMQGQSPYSASKIGSDRIAESFHRSFGLPIVTVRPFNTYGPRQSARAVIPTIITQLLAGMPEIKLGAVHPTRDLVYVRDTVEGFCRLAECDAAVGQEINIATQNEISVGDLAQKIIGQINPSAKIIHDGIRMRPAQSEVERLLGANEKLSRLTNWKPLTDIDTGITETISWFRTQMHRYKPEVYNL